MAFLEEIGMIKAVFFDCDGTLLSHHSGVVPASAKQALADLRKKGIRTILSTGRHVSELAQLEPMHGIEFDAYITLNGACSYDADGIFDSHPIDREDIERVHTFLQTNDLPIQFLEETENYISSVNETVIRSQAMIHTPVPPVKSFERIMNHPVYMFIPFGIREFEPLEAQLRHVKCTRWNAHDAIDVFHEDAGKEKGMQAWMERYGIDRSETAAFGDAMNDSTMLETAGLGIAMGNSTEELKAIADYVTDDIDDNGVANALRALGIL